MSPRRGSYIITQLDSINLRLQNLFDDIGLGPADREDRERQVYSVISEALESYVSQIKVERDKLKHQCESKQQEIQSMARTVPDVDLSQVIGSFQIPQLQDQQPHSIIDLLYSDAVIQTPYTRTYEMLSEASARIKEVYEERASMADNFYSELEDLDYKLNGKVPNFTNGNDQNCNKNDNRQGRDDPASREYYVEIQQGLARPKSIEEADLSLTRLTKLDTEIQRLRHEFQSRVARVSIAAAQIVAFWAELGTPQNEIDSNMMSYYKTEPEKIGTTPSDMVRIERLLESLANEKDRRSERIRFLSDDIYKLWEKLDEDTDYMQEFEHSNRGLGLAALDAFEKEHARLMKKKKDNVGVFIQDARSQLEKLWDQLYFSEQETYEFTPAWADIFTDASLEAHEAEISRLEKLLVERGPIIKLIDQYRDLQDEEKELLASTQDASRLLGTRGVGGAAPKRDPSRLLREEQMRKRIAKRKPKVMQDLKAGLDEWLERTGEPFYIHGEDFGKVLDEEMAKSANSRYGKLGHRPAANNAKASVKEPPSSGTSSSLGGRRIASTAVPSTSRLGGILPARSVSRAGGEPPSPTKPALIPKTRSGAAGSTTSSLSRQPSSASPSRSQFGRPTSPTKPSTFGNRAASASPTKPSPFGQSTSPIRPIPGRASPTRQAFGRSASPTRPNQSYSSPTRQPSPLRKNLPTQAPIGRSATSLGMRTNSSAPGVNLSNAPNPSLPRPTRPNSVFGHRTTSSTSNIPNGSIPRSGNNLNGMGVGVAGTSGRNPLSSTSTSSPSNISPNHIRSRSEFGHRPGEYTSPQRPNSRLGNIFGQSPQTPLQPPTKLGRLSELSLGSPTFHSTMLMDKQPYSSNNGSTRSNGSDGSDGSTGSNKENRQKQFASTPTKPFQYRNNMPSQDTQETNDVAMEDEDDGDNTATEHRTENTIIYNNQGNAQVNKLHQQEMHHMQQQQRALQRLHAEAMAKAQEHSQHGNGFGNNAGDQSSFMSMQGYGYTPNKMNNGAYGNGQAFNAQNNNILNTPLMLPTGSSTPLTNPSLANTNTQGYDYNNGMGSGMRGGAGFSQQSTPYGNGNSHQNFGSQGQYSMSEMSTINDPSMRSNFDDPMYQHWRRQALQQLGNGSESIAPSPMATPSKHGLNNDDVDTNMMDHDGNRPQNGGRSRHERLSAFDWDTDTF